ncbi:MAG: cation diffusion facilitator family transporter [Finegoldia magna]|uniref:cation diffusion facilitator family transporter n=2 Tax=Peptoniphilaceae TaxID=1570339 RepID=UPI0025ED60F8|nr:cation diffusion facilitator family transporter [Finegoldia magna]MDU7502016.1 cation diffusion facilitator family transporter [Finegoldia magna]
MFFNMKEKQYIMDSQSEREKIIIKTSFLGIITNVFLAIFKVILGLITNSIAVILDAINNFSDALSSVVTIVGAKLASKAPDKKHPMGYGRIEYLSSMVVSAIVLYAGITSFVESVKKIFNPQIAQYSTVSIFIIGVAVVVKFILGKYVKKQGKKVNSGALIASGADSIFDSILSTSVFISAIIYTIWNISLEAYVGVLLSAFIIKAGIEMMTETIGNIIGQRQDAEISKRIKEIINEEKQVIGAYDLVLFNYGPNKYYATVHLELPDNMTVDEVDQLTRKLQLKVYNQMEIILIGVGVYSFNTKDDEAARIRNDVQKLILSHDWALQIHGFYVDIEEKNMRFDVIVSFDKDFSEAIEIITDEVQQRYPEYKIMMVPDIDFTDI